MLKLTTLNVDTVILFDPRIRELIDRELRKVSLDLWDRPTEKKARKLTIEMAFVPVPETSNGVVSCDQGRMVLKVKTTTPHYATIDFPVEVTKAGMRFNADCPDSLNQHTMFGGPNGDDDE